VKSSAKIGLRTVVRAGVALCAILLALQSDAQHGSSTSSLGLRLIVVGSQEEAEDVLERLARGQDFEALAREKSIDTTAGDGGYLGKVDPSTLRPELRDALRGVQPGRYTGVVRIPTGYAVLLVLSDRDSPSFKDDNNPTRILAASATGAVKSRSR
jgi:parvulin-like peptidyl-prolyl isomerase